MRGFIPVEFERIDGMRRPASGAGYRKVPIRQDGMSLPFLLTGRAQSSQLRRVRTPKEFEFESCSVPNPTVFEPRACPGDTGKADCSLSSEFEKPLGSGSHCLRKEATRGAKWLTGALLGRTTQVPHPT